MFYLPTLEASENQLNGPKWTELCPKEDYYPFANVSFEETWYKYYDFATNAVARFSWYLIHKGIVPNTGHMNRLEMIESLPPNYEPPLFIECAPMYLLYGLKNKAYLNPDTLGYTGDYIKLKWRDMHARVTMGNITRKGGIDTRYIEDIDCHQYHTGSHASLRLYGE